MMRMSSRDFQYIAMFLLAASPVVAVADDQEPPKSDPAKQADPKADEAKGKEGSLLDKLSKELFKDLDEGQAKKPEKDNKLERAANGMRDAGDKLNENQTGQDTRKVQEQVIRANQANAEPAPAAPWTRGRWRWWREQQQQWVRKGKPVPDAKAWRRAGSVWTEVWTR
jgi:hypothetical protein